MKNLCIILAVFSFPGLCQAMFSDARVSALVVARDWDTIAYQVDTGRISAAQLSIYTFDQLNQKCAKECVLLDRLVQYVSNVEYSIDASQIDLKNTNLAYHTYNTINEDQKKYSLLVACITTLVKRNLVNSKHQFGAADTDKKSVHCGIYQRIIVQAEVDFKLHKAQLARMQFQYLVTAFVAGISWIILGLKCYTAQSHGQDDSLEDEQIHDEPKDLLVTAD